MNLKHSDVFTRKYYEKSLKIDVIKLKKYPNDPKFENNKFWSPASFKKKTIPNRYKMKWHQVGNGRVQLRLPVGLLSHAYLCEAYVKMMRKKSYECLLNLKRIFS